MGALNLSGVLEVGPTGSTVSFPASSITVPLSLINSPGSYGAATGVLTQTIANPSAFVALSGVGPTGPVKSGTFLYLKTDGPCSLRLTCNDGAGGQTVATQVIHGLAAWEFPSNKALELLEIQGSARIEYLVVGPS